MDLCNWSGSSVYLAWQKLQRWTLHANSSVQFSNTCPADKYHEPLPFCSFRMHCYIVDVVGLTFGGGGGACLFVCLLACL